MNLLFLYGPPAAGKLTIAKELAKMTGYKLYDNHTIISPLAELFSYTDPVLNPIRSSLGERIRLDIFKTAAQAGVNLITTSGRGGEKDFIFFREIKEAVEQNGGSVLFVQVSPSKETLLQRVDQPSRLGVKADTRERLEEILEENPGLFEKFPDEGHLSIDNTEISAINASEMIVDYYKLT